jgi:PPM family protein phosphatase
MHASPHLVAGIVTDPGQQRSNNEDLFHVDEEQGLFVVVDGVGGQAAGEEAARIAVDAIRDRFDDPAGDTEERIREAIALANNRIFQRAESRPELRGMGCVLTLAVVEGRTVTIGHVGDSRLYQIRNGRMNKITLDHSPVGESEDRGELSEAEAMAHPRRNEVYRDIGAEPHQPGDPGFIEIFRTSLPYDAALLLSSDGLTDMLTRDQMLRIIETYDGDPHRIARELVTAANDAGGKDNITVIFVPGSEFGAVHADKITRRLAPTPPREPLVASAATRPAATRASDPSILEASAPTPAPQPVSARRPAYRDSIGRWRWLIVFSALLLALAAVLWIVRPSWIPYAQPGPATLHVGAGRQFNSIAAALTAAHEGDRILVATGVYSENVTLKSGVALLSSEPRKAEIRAAGIALNAESVNNARISGFRILPAGIDNLEIGIRAQDASLRIDNCEISRAADAGVSIGGHSTVDLRDNFIHDNAAAGVRIADSNTPNMQANRICDNGQDIVPLSPLAASANTIGPCPALPDARSHPRSNPARPVKQSP